MTTARLDVEALYPDDRTAREVALDERGAAPGDGPR
jgi:hypothetical protein